MLVMAIALSNKQSFVSEPGVSCLLPTLMKLWQANLLASKWSEILRTFIVLHGT